jgi:hypothetical protein
LGSGRVRVGKMREDVGERKTGRRGRVKERKIGKG